MRKVILRAGFLMLLVVALATSAAAATKPKATPKPKKEAIVYIAPESGVRYHAKKTCRGLNKANEVVSYKISECPTEYTPCKICKPAKLPGK